MSPVAPTAVTVTVDPSVGAPDDTVIAVTLFDCFEEYWTTEEKVSVVVQTATDCGKSGRPSYTVTV
jgi:hypothetical protein